MTDTPDPMAEIRSSFFIECDELLEALQDGLQTIEDGDDGSETINAVFRAVHSIKGGAGAFGLEGLVRFAHRFETVLDGVRSGKMIVTPDLLALFFASGDHLRDLVHVCRDDDPLPQNATDALLVRLSVFCEDEDEEAEEPIEFKPMGMALDLGLGSSTEPFSIDELPDFPNSAYLPNSETLQISHYIITFTPTGEMFETGNEPAALLRNLQALGEASVTCITDALPEFPALVPEVSYLNWHIVLKTTVDRSEIVSVFEFVEGLCELDIQDGEQETQIARSKPVVVTKATKQKPVPALQTEVQDQPTDQPVTSSPFAKIEPAKSKPSQGNAQAANAVVRVDLERIERLVNLVGELVINQAMLSQSLEH